MNQKKVFVAGGVVLLGLILWLTREIPYCGWDFHNSLWGPINLMHQHHTPYTFDAPYGPYPGVWMPTALGAFFWFGFLSCDTAMKLWVLTEIAGFIWIIWMIADYKMPSRWIFFICLIMLALFPPIWYHLELGQFSMLFVVLMMIIVYIPESQKFWPLLLVLGMTKPQLTVLIYPGLLFSIWKRQGFSQALKLVGLTALCAGIFLIPVFLYYPNWVKDFLYITLDNFGIAWDLPTLFIQLPFLIGNTGYIVWGLMAILSMGISLWFWLKKDPKIALLVSLAATPMVTTYASSWDFLLLMPGFFWLIIRLKSMPSRIFLIVSMILLAIIQIALRWQRDYPDGRQWWMPPAMILAYIVTLGIDALVVYQRKQSLSKVSVT